MFKKIKLSNILMVLLVGQYIYTLLILSGNYHSSYFSAEHEDTIFIMHLMSWFIVKAIENLKVTIEVIDMR